MYRNKHNGKIVTDVIFTDDRVLFTIDGINVSLEVEIFIEYYEVMV
jgi:hypothetical protein